MTGGKTDGRGLTQDEKEWAEKWYGSPVIVGSTSQEVIDQILEAA